MDLESIWYEFSPYLYALAGAVSVLTTNSKLSVFSGILLLAASATILRLRWLHRHKPDLKRKRPSR